MARNPLDKIQFDKFDRNYNLIGQLFAKVKLPFGIEYEMDFNNRFRFQYGYTYMPSYTVDALLLKGSAERVNYTQYDWSLDNILRWERNICKRTQSECHFALQFIKMDVMAEQCQIYRLFSF